MHIKSLITTVVVGLSLIGCGESKEQAAVTVEADSAWLLASMPTGAENVALLKTSAKAGDEVVMRGTIGGTMNPMTAGSAVFVVMDPEIPSCADAEDDKCATPWDYCCESSESKIANNATVQLVDADGRLLEIDLAEHGFNPLDDVVIVGTVEPRPSGDVLIIKATGIHRIEG